MGHSNLLTEELFTIFDIIVIRNKIILWIQKCVLALIFANTFEITELNDLYIPTIQYMYIVSCIYGYNHM